MATLADVYRAIEQLETDGVVEDYAVGGGMAALFYAETTPTFDVDVFSTAWSASRSFAHLQLGAMPPEYLVALYIQTGGDKRRGRARDLFAQNVLKNELLKDLLVRYNLMDKWRQNGGEEL